MQSNKRKNTHEFISPIRPKFEDTWQTQRSCWCQPFWSLNCAFGPLWRALVKLQMPWSSVIEQVLVVIWGSVQWSLRGQAFSKWIVSVALKASLLSLIIHPSSPRCWFTSTNEGRVTQAVKRVESCRIAGFEFGRCIILPSGCHGSCWQFGHVSSLGPPKSPERLQRSSAAMLQKDTKNSWRPVGHPWMIDSTKALSDFHDNWILVILQLIEQTWRKTIDKTTCHSSLCQEMLGRLFVENFDLRRKLRGSQGTLMSKPSAGGKTVWIRIFSLWCQYLSIFVILFFECKKKWCRLKKKASVILAFTVLDLDFSLQVNMRLPSHGLSWAMVNGWSHSERRGVAWRELQPKLSFQVGVFITGGITACIWYDFINFER